VKYVLDTNIVTRLLTGDERVLGHLAGVEPSDVRIPLLVLAELLFGAEKSVRKEQNGARIKQMTQTFPMLPADAYNAACRAGLGIIQAPRSGMAAGLESGNLSKFYRNCAANRCPSRWSKAKPGKRARPYGP
jgi:hypothetical protein